MRIDSTTFVGTIKDVEVSILNYTPLANDGVCCTVLDGEFCELPSESPIIIPISYSLFPISS